MPPIRIPLASLALVLAACTTAPPPAPTPAAAPQANTYPVTPEEEAVLLRLEDRREYDPEVVERWSVHSNAAHRRRIAIALGRIGTAAFDDANGNGVQDEGETMAGVRELGRLAGDPSHEVRIAAAFALGEIGDPAGVDTLIALAGDPEHAGVASEALEALSKMPGKVPFERYATWTGPAHPEGVRSRAIRFLFRFEQPEAAALAASLLSDPEAIVRREAAYSLSRRTHAPARERLHLLLTDPDTLTRAYAARALGRIAEEESVDPLLAALGDVHPWVRTNAVVALAQIAAAHEGAIGWLDAEDTVRILTLARDPDPGTRISAIEALGHAARTNETARATLLEIAADGSQWQREVATAAFIRHVGPADAEAVGSLMATDARFVKIRALEATQALGEDGDAIRRRFLDDPDAAVRAAALGSIADERTAAWREVIEAALADDDPVVRSVAIGRYSTIASIPPAEKLVRLRSEAARAEADALNDARVAAVSAAAGLEGSERLEWLEELVRDDDPVVRRIAAEALARAGRPRPGFTPLPVERSLDEYAAIARWSQETHTVTLHTSRGEVEIILLASDAPMTAWNFATLAARDYFDGTTFMRVVPNFVIQGGDPRNDQSGGPGYAIRDEINPQKYTRGAVGMALSGPDTGGSQFFITHSPQHHLDGGYTIFGRVVGGMSGVVDQIERGDRVIDLAIDELSAGEVNVRVAAVERPPLPLEIGPITPERLLSFVPEYPERKAAYEPDPAVVEAIATSIRPGDRMEVYLGTWCSDSQREVPKLLKILDLLRDDYGVSLPVDWVALDRSKSEPAEAIEGKNIEKVATFIYYRDGEETGRIVETPTGLFEDHFMQIVAAP
ncbi:MAG TPA: HEAT repeat domain-containing protein [Thermoanaerobaculia bacterium]|nr:HEAT repeat domain-containing protein [Thermoanaerobaculia bacterium]